MSRLREGRANTARGAAHFLRETVGRVRYGGARGQLTMRADSGCYTHDIVAACRDKSVRYSITVRQRRAYATSSRPYPKRTGRPSRTGWRAPPTWRRQLILPSRTSPTPCRCGSSSGRVKPTPGSQLALFATDGCHAFSADRKGQTLELEADHRRHAEIENAIGDLKYGVGLNHLPSGRFAANGAWLAVQVMAHNLARWTARIGLGEPVVTTKTLRRRFFSMPGRLTRSARRRTLHLPPALALGKPVQSRPRSIASPATPSLTAAVCH